MHAPAFVSRTHTHIHTHTHTYTHTHTHTHTQVELIRRDYVANGGWETFLSYEDPVQDILIGAVFSFVFSYYRMCSLTIECVLLL